MYTIDNGWNPVTGEYFVNGQVVSEDEFNRQQVQKFITQSRSEGDTTLSDLFNSADYQGATIRGTPGVDQQGLYNWGNGQSSWVPMGDSRFVPAPQHQDSLAESNGDWINMNNNGGHMIPLLALTAGTISGAAGAEGAAVGEGSGAAISGAGTSEGVGAAGGGSWASDASLAGGGEVGSGYAASAPGSAGGTTGGTLSNTSSAETLTGSTTSSTGQSDTLGSNTMLDDYGNPLDMSNPGGGGDPGYTGNNNDPGYMYDVNGNPATAPGTQSPELSTDYMAMVQKAKDMAAQFGVTPASALKYLMGAAARGAPAVLGAVAANKQANSLQDLASQYMGFGAPSRARYEASFSPGFTMANDPGYTDALNQTSKASMHALSVNGNPAGSPNAWNRTMQDVYERNAYPALQNFRNQNASTGGIASFSAAAPGAATGAIGARGNVFNALGAGANDIFSPKPSLAETLADYKRLTGAP